MTPKDNNKTGTNLSSGSSVELYQFNAYFDDPKRAVWIIERLNEYDVPQKRSLIKAIKNLDAKRDFSEIAIENIIFDYPKDIAYSTFIESYGNTFKKLLRTRSLPDHIKLLIVDQYIAFFPTIKKHISELNRDVINYLFPDTELHRPLKGISEEISGDIIESIRCERLKLSTTIRNKERLGQNDKRVTDGFKIARLLLRDMFFPLPFKVFLRDYLCCDKSPLTNDQKTKVMSIPLCDYGGNIISTLNYDSDCTNNLRYLKHKKDIIYTYLYVYVMCNERTGGCLKFPDYSGGVLDKTIAFLMTRILLNVRKINKVDSSSKHIIIDRSYVKSMIKHFDIYDCSPTATK